MSLATSSDADEDVRVEVEARQRVLCVPEGREVVVVRVFDRADLSTGEPLNQQLAPLVGQRLGGTCDVQRLGGSSVGDLDDLGPLLGLAALFRLLVEVGPAFCLPQLLELLLRIVDDGGDLLVQAIDLRDPRCFIL